MRVDDGVAMIVYRKNQENKREYLILKRDKNWQGWEIPKGHLEHNSFKATILIELNEEAGIEPIEVKKIKELDEYLTFQFEEDDKKIVSNFKCFEIEVRNNTNIDLSKNPSSEHTTHDWLTKKNAISKLEYKEQKEIVKES